MYIQYILFVSTHLEIVFFSVVNDDYRQLVPVILPRKMFPI